MACLSPKRIKDYFERMAEMFSNLTFMNNCYLISDKYQLLECVLLKNYMGCKTFIRDQEANDEPLCDLNLAKNS